MTPSDAVKISEELLPCTENCAKRYQHQFNSVHGAGCAAVNRTNAAAALLAASNAGYERGRAEGLEEAAQVCDRYARRDHPTAVTVTDLAGYDIRALITAPPTNPTYKHKLEELRRYVIKRGNENQERARGAYGTEASLVQWFNAKADTYQRIEAKLDKILSVIPAEPEGERSEWRDIASAPKDHFAILVYCPDNKCSFTVIWSSPGWTYFGGARFERLIHEPSHWMPLPTPPATRER